MVSYLHNWGQAGWSFISPGKLGPKKEAEEVGDVTHLFLHWREGCLANSLSALKLLKANKQYKGKTVGLNRRAREAEIDNKLMNNRDITPGPRTTLQKAARTRRRLKRHTEKRSHERKRKEAQCANAELDVQILAKSPGTLCTFCILHRTFTPLSPWNNVDFLQKYLR